MEGMGQPDSGRDGVAQTELFEYGIQTEHSDIRAHVSVVNRTIYVFKTAAGVAATERAEQRTACQPGVDGPTAEGWVVPVEQIGDLRRLRFESWAGWDEFLPTLTTSQKGALAVACVREAMRLGRFPFWVDAVEDDRENVQILGTDILVFCRKKVQVKCDYRCGDRPRGTGNVFLQRAERNPLKRR
jgi:hypothetical protein